MALRDSPEQMRKYKREWRAKRRAVYFRGKSCVQCGSTTDLELDHIDPELKIHHAIWSWSQVRREEELSKCQVLCSRCHDIKTARQQGKTSHVLGLVHGTSTAYQLGCRCNRCRYQKNWEARAFYHLHKVAILGRRKARRQIAKNRGLTDDLG